jgi:hypothetical protein
MPTAAQPRETNTHTPRLRVRILWRNIENCKPQNAAGRTPKQDENAESHRMRNKKRRRISLNKWWTDDERSYHISKLLLKIRNVQIGAVKPLFQKLNDFSNICWTVHTVCVPSVNRLITNRLPMTEHFSRSFSINSCSFWVI